MTRTGRYLYAITRGTTSDALGAATGLDGQRLATVEHRGLVAVVSDVDLEEYGEEGLTRNLERLDWLERVARTHDEVVHAVAEHGPTAPLRLATICLDDDGVRDRLAEWHASIERVLDRVEGHQEWSVKVFAPPAPRPAEPVGVTSGGGADYLRRKKAATQARLEAEEAAVGAGDAVYAALAAGSAASRRLAAQDPRLSGHEGTMLLNAAYLVPAGDAAAFEASVHATAAEHPALVVDCQGP